MDPVGRVVEFPIRMAVALLERIPGAHAQLNRNDIRLFVRKAIICTGEMRGVAIRRKDVAGKIVALSHRFEFVRILLKDCAKPRMAVVAGRVIDGSDGQIMDHPTFIPSTLVVDHEQAVDICKDVDKSLDIVWISRQSRLGLEHYAHRADRGQIAIRAGRGEHRLIVYAREQLGEWIRLKIVRIQQVVLKELAGLGFERRLVGMCLGVGLSGQLAVRSARQFNQPVLQRIRQMTDIPAVADFFHILLGVRIRQRRRWRRFLGVTDGTGNYRHEGAQQYSTREDAREYLLRCAATIHRLLHIGSLLLLCDRVETKGILLSNRCKDCKNRRCFPLRLYRL